MGLPTTLATKVEARKQSKVVTPNNLFPPSQPHLHNRYFALGTHLFGSNTPFFFNTSAKIGTVELTGLEMTKMNALGQASAMASARTEQILALI